MKSQKEREKLDFSSEIEIPRAEDLAGRTEKLLVDYLDGLEIAENIGKLLKKPIKIERQLR